MGEACDLLLAVARRVGQRVAGRHEQHRWRPAVIDRDARLLDARQPLVNPLVESAGNHGIGRHEVDAFEAGHPRQQIPVRRKQALAVGRVIANRQHDVPPGVRRRFTNQLTPKHVVVNAVRHLDKAFEMPEHGHQKAGLPDEPFGAAVLGRARFQRAKHVALEGIDALQISLKGVVKPHDLGDEARAQAKRGLASLFDSRPAGHTRQDFTFGIGKQHRVPQPLSQPPGQLPWRDQVGQYESGVWREESALDRS